MFGDAPPRIVDPRSYVGKTLRVSPTQSGINPWLCVRAYASTDGWHIVLRYPDHMWDAPVSSFTSIQVVNPIGGQKPIGSFGMINEAESAGW